MRVYLLQYMHISYTYIVYVKQANVFCSRSIIFFKRNHVSIYEKSENKFYQHLIRYKTSI